VCALGLLPWVAAGVFPTALSPWVAGCSALARRSVDWVVALGVPAAVLVLVRRRGFCRWVCPVGLLVERVGRMRVRRHSAAARLPTVGQWVALITLGAAAGGYPLLVWLDPLAMLAALGGLPARPATTATLLAALALPLVLLIELLMPGFWCARSCPLGGLQDVAAWPAQRLAARRAAGAGLPRRPAPSAWTLSRRVILGSGIGAFLGMFIMRRRAKAQPVLRPPGAVEESRFTGLCVRCGSCGRVCPSRLIYPHLEPEDIAGLLAPVVRFDVAGDYCPPNCRACTQVCPSGAIARVSLEEKNRHKIGLARVVLEHCWLKQQRECSECLTSCPYQAITIAYDEFDFSSYPIVDADLCPGCGACEVACPAEPQKAIVVRP